jgi:hypothetical protein
MNDDPIRQGVCGKIKLGLVEKKVRLPIDLAKLIV